MPVYAYLGGVHRKAKCVWWWDGAAWQKAQNAYIYEAGVWQSGYAKPDMANTLAGLTDSATAPANIAFTWTLVGQLYAATVELFANGISFAGPLDAEVYSTGITVGAADPTMTWTAETKDGNSDVIRTRTAVITGP